MIHPKVPGEKSLPSPTSGHQHDPEHVSNTQQPASNKWILFPPQSSGSTGSGALSPAELISDASEAPEAGDRMTGETIHRIICASGGKNYSFLTPSGDRLKMEIWL